MYFTSQTEDVYNEIHGINVVKKTLRCLGIYIGHDNKGCLDKNWNSMYDDVQKLFSHGKNEN